jgi:hypothetical protein
MKVSTKAVSPYLAQEDIADPIIVTMNNVTINTALRNQEVLHFSDEVKPLPLNLTNKRAIVAAYGDETNAWRGQRIELYINPDVTNSKGEVTGGIRLRIPAAPPAPKPTSTAEAAARQRERPTPAEAHARALDGMGAAVTRDNLDQWAQWGKKLRLSPEQYDEQQDAYLAALERIATANTARRRQTA